MLFEKLCQVDFSQVSLFEALKMEVLGNKVDRFHTGNWDWVFGGEFWLPEKPPRKWNYSSILL